MAKNINEIINTLPIARRRKIEKMAAQMIAEEITLQNSPKKKSYSSETIER